MTGWCLIYELVDPRTLAPRYVGLTTWRAEGIEESLQHRLQQHINTRAKAILDRRQWLEELWSLDLRPIIRLLDTCPSVEAPELETDWMMKRWDEGHDLLNSAGRGRAMGTLADARSRLQAKIESSQRSQELASAR